MIIRTVGQRVMGRHGPATITALGRLRGEDVVYVLWDEPRHGAENPDRRDTVRARDVVPIAAAPSYDA